MTWLPKPNSVLVFILFTLLAAACTKGPPASPTTQVRKEDPAMAARDIEVLFSDSGVVEARLTARVMHHFEGSDPYIDFPEGFRVEFFDSLNRVSTTITGDRGMRKETTRTMEAWGHVVVRNELKNEQLNTEHLVWDENHRSIRSDVEVKITRPGQTLNGTSLESNESFTRYSIEGVTGEMNVKNDSL